MFRIEEQLKMPYLSYVERRGERRGLSLLLRTQLEQRFAPLPAALIERLEQADAEQLLRWGTRLNDAGSLDEVFADGDGQPPSTPEQPRH
ncbi:hypothetical protein CKO31_16730 [Thiohalocapsa halophila]|uniref:DUF4351 domain-containing protein n=2 Tax=Thiohalocapsa halophila TaxID=69359 RepID=A0ABS1CLY6_9GAMM|nr:hypothetical protein [Thiohalocapsa halophila]